MADLRLNCRPLRGVSPPNKPIVVTDLSNSSGKVYVFNGGGDCIKIYSSNSWGHGGRGLKSRARPKPCSSAQSKLNPAGLHLLTDHKGSKYNNHDRDEKNDALKMQGLEGQGSAGRGILFHGGHPQVGSTSIGCNAMGTRDFLDLKKKVQAMGGLAYNYFGESAPPAHCKKKKGYNSQGKMPSCKTVTQNLGWPTRIKNWFNRKLNRK